MKIVLFLTSLFIVLAVSAYFYNMQLGAIPFLLLSIFFLRRAWKIWKNSGTITQKEEDR